MPTAVGAITREHLEEPIGDLLEEHSAGYAGNRYRSLLQFFRWCAEEGEIPRSPMAQMHPPKPVEWPPAVIAPEQRKALFKACEGRDFAARRDAAILSLLLDTGMRRAEIANLTVDDLDLDLQVAHVIGKGRKPRACPFGHRTAQALDRYLRLRGQRPDRSLCRGHHPPLVGADRPGAVPTGRAAAAHGGRGRLQRLADQAVEARVAATGE